MTAPLWHFTCTHGYAGIGARGTLRPNRHPLLPRLAPMVWLTDDPAPERDAVGLSSTFLRCDRMAYRYRVTAPDALPWADVRAAAPPFVLVDLERYGQPGTWWVSFVPVAAALR